MSTKDPTKDSTPGAAMSWHQSRIMRIADRVMFAALFAAILFLAGTIATRGM